jgi:hypothetical protein
LTVRVEGGSLQARISAWLLSGMGARVDCPAPREADWRFVVPARPAVSGRADVVIKDGATASEGAPVGSGSGSGYDRPGLYATPVAILRLGTGSVPADPGVPPGTWSYATGVALATAALAAWRSRRNVEVTELGVAIQVHLPQVMSAAYAAPAYPAPPQPRPAPGGGWFQADLGVPGEEEELAVVLSTLGPRADAAAVAAAAQDWRLPVCHYRTRPVGDRFPPAIPVTVAAGSSRRRPEETRPHLPPLSRVEICDLTTMWAGPLCTWICQTLGATVVKVEPAFRPDGTRAATGGGIYPMGRQRLPGADSGLWNALNRGKQHVDLDLRLPRDREEFLELAGRSDLVVDSFSPRVMPNFGLDRELPGPRGSSTALSMPGFPPGAHRDWVSYGTGIHALIGLGDLGDGRFGAPAVSYPDPVAGLTAAFAATCAVVARDLGQPVGRMEVPLQSAALPLLALGRAGQPWGSPHSRTIGELLLDEGRPNGEFVIREVAGLQLEHPIGPIRSAAPPGAA